MAAGETEILAGATETSATVKSGAGTLTLTGDGTFKRIRTTEGSLVFSGGTTAISDTTATAANTANAVFGQDAGATTVKDGATVTASGGNYVIVNNGTFTIENGTFDATGLGQHVMNAFDGTGAGGSKIVINDGGVLKANYLRASGAGADTADKKEVAGIELNKGGELHVGQFWTDNNADRYGRIWFNGGVLRTMWSGKGDNGKIAVAKILFIQDETRRPWMNDQITPTIMEGGCYIHTTADNYVHKSFASGASADGGLHHLGTGVLYWQAKDSTFNGGLWLESNNGAVFGLHGPVGDSCLGVVPAEPETNIHVVGSNHSLFSDGGTFEIHRNRNISIASGRNFRTGTQGSLVIHGEIKGEPNAELGYATSTSLEARQSWPGATVLDPGEGRTNDVGRLIVGARIDVTSGVTQVATTINGGTAGNNALVYVKGLTSGFADGYGQLFVNGGTLYAPTPSDTRYLIAETNAQVVVSNGGRIEMPGVTYVNGFRSPAKLTITNGTVSVANIQLANSAEAEINLLDGGILETRNFWSNVGTRGTINFDGGGVRSQNNSLYLGNIDNTARWADDRLVVKEGGAVFDTPFNLWLDLPLESGAENDGGIRKTGSQTLVMRVAGSTYNGPTVIENGVIQLRADDALPAGGTVVLKNGSYITFCKYDTAAADYWAKATRTSQTLGRVEGDGVVNYSAKVKVTGAVAPSVGGTVRFAQTSGLTCDLEVDGDATGCGCLSVAAGQDVSGIAVKVVDYAKLDRSASSTFYKILDAPNGYVGTLQPGNVAYPWYLKYSDKAAYLALQRGMVVTIR